MSDPSSESSLFRDPRLVWGAAIVLFAIGLIRRAFLGHIPGDFSAYLHAADLFVGGENPYTEARFTAPRYDGFPYNYFPGTLYLIAPLAFMSSALAASVEWVLRSALIFGSALGLRRVFPERDLSSIVLVMMAHEPLMIDGLVGNIVTYLFAAYVGLLVVSARPRDTKGIAVGFVAGVIFGFKPFWYIPAGFLLISRRRWAELVAALAGTSLVVGLSFLHAEWYPAFLEHTRAMREFYVSIDLLSLTPSLYPIVLGIGAIVGMWLLLRRAHPDLWLLGCVSMVIWPRLATYSYVLTIPFVLYLMQRFGAWRGALLSAGVIGPIPWLVRDSGVLPSTQAEGVLMLAWTSVWALVFVFWMARTRPEDADVA